MAIPSYSMSSFGFAIGTPSIVEFEALSNEGTRFTTARAPSILLMFFASSVASLKVAPSLESNTTKILISSEEDFSEAE